MSNGKMAGCDKAFVWIVAILCATILIILVSCLLYYHYKPESLRLEEERSARLDRIFDYLRFKEETMLKLYLTHIKDIADAAGTNLTENEVKEIQERSTGVTKEPNFDLER